MLVLAEDLTLERLDKLAGCVVIEDGRTYVDVVLLADLFGEVEL